MTSTKIGQQVLIVVMIAVLGGAIIYVASKFPHPVTKNPTSGSMTSYLVRAASAEDLRRYLATTTNLGNSGIMVNTLDAGLTNGIGAAPKALPSSIQPERTSATNVQVAGIDEPDILKVSGSQLFVSNESPWYYGTPMMITLDKLESGAGVSATPTTNLPTPTDPNLPTGPFAPTHGTTAIIHALPPATPTTAAVIDEGGNLLTVGNRLIVIGTNRITGYDVTDPTKPQKSWTADLGDSTSVVTARLRDGQVYLVTQQSLNVETPCPVAVMKMATTAISIPCNRVFYPSTPTTTDTTFSALRINPTDGTVGASWSFVGSANNVTVMMSDQALYLATTIPPDPFLTQYAFFTTDGADLVSPTVVEKLRKLQGYDISSQAKQTELYVILGQYQSSLSATDQTKLNNDLAERMKTYGANHRRELDHTTIARVTLPDLTLAATGDVPGHLINQFAMDEFNGSLRLATTIDGSWYFGVGDPVNDLYTLDANMSQTGSLLDLGKGESITSVRFIGKFGYLVTFKQTDPFHVVDLSNPAKPLLVGQLELPGYSAYLDPLSNTIIFGVGQEGAKTKAALFDVSDPTKPQELSRFLMDYGWTEIANNHHAFLNDAKHHVVVIPTGQNTQILSYDQNALTVKLTVDEPGLRRAAYINDNLYLVSPNKIIVVDEQTWKQVGQVNIF